MLVHILNTSLYFIYFLIAFISVTFSDFNSKRNIICCLYLILFSGGSYGKVSALNAGDQCSIPRLGRSSGEGNGNPLQYSCLENSMDGGACWATVHAVTRSWTQLNEFSLSLSHNQMGFPGGSDRKESACNGGDLGSIPGLGKSPGGRHDYPLQYSYLENPHRQRSLAGYSP